MGYCAICGRYHDSRTGCFDNDLGLTPDGVDQTPHGSPSRFKTIARQADRFILKLLLIGLLVIVGVMVLTAVLRR